MKPSRHLTSSSQLALLTLLGFISVSFGQTGTSDKAQLARVMWSAFQCGTYAGLSDDENEQTRLFLVGLKAGREFLDAVNKGQITDEAKRKIVPVVVLEVLGSPIKNVGGPSADFVLGRIFQFATSTASNMVAVPGTTGYVSGSLTDAAHTKSNAQAKYIAGNCVLVK